MINELPELLPVGRPMQLMVHHMRDLLDPLSEIWKFNPLCTDFVGAVAVAREGYADILDYPHAVGLRIVDDTGLVIVEEIRVRR